MSKLTDIKYRIGQLDGGAFQNLCDEFLTCRGYGPGYSLGMYTGTDKTAKGNPDTYFLTTNNKYVFVMYTTQKTDFFSKALEDLEKCFDSTKTGISPEDVVEIVYCHTYGRLSPGEHKILHDYCNDRNAALTLLGIDSLGSDIYHKYPRIAKDFLGISVDTGQITSISEFVSYHDANIMSAPLNTEFLFRQDELEAAKEKLELSNVLVISGPAGVGKTRLALEICRELADEYEYEVLCIKSNTLELYDDLTAALDVGKDYLVFVDDANELTGLRFVLDYLQKTGAEQRNIQKIVMTVRDYARVQVVQQVLEVEKPELLKVGILKDDDIIKLMENAFGITNHLYLERIVNIAEGNARLAMLAGKVASTTNNIESIRDASELYENYYGKQIETISKSETEMAAAGIMAFFQALHLDYLAKLQPIFSSMRITEEHFISDIKHLHDLELVDLCHDKAARVSDQSFSNYLIKYVFIDKKLVPLNEIIMSGFFINKNRTITACNILLNVFSEEQVREYVEQQINIVWDQLQPDQDNFWPFFKVFHMLRPTESLLIIEEMIAQTDCCSADVHTIEFKKNDSPKGIEDEIIDALSHFENHSQLPEALDLLFIYYQKRPDLFEEVYSVLVSCWGVNKDSHIYGYFTQKTVVNKLIELINDNPMWRLHRDIYL